MSNFALLLTDGLLDQGAAKTAHGLIFGTSRYNIAGVIDAMHANQDAGLVLGQQEKNIPVFADIPQALTQLKIKPDYCIVGVAPIGGQISKTLEKTLIEAASLGMNLVSGLHTLLSEHPVIAPLAKEKGIELIDIRKSKPRSQLAMWSGKIAFVKTPRIAVIGTDCAIGKRTTSGLLLALCKANNIKAEMIYTGQTGWLQNLNYGFILDSTINDFVAGEMEKAIFDCVREVNPELIFIEGQSSLRNPSGPCGAELLCSAGTKYVVLQHNPYRQYYVGDTTNSFKIPDIEEEIALIKYYGAEVIAITLNSQGRNLQERMTIQQQIAAKTGIPVVYPREDGVNVLLPLFQKLVKACPLPDGPLPC